MRLDAKARLPRASAADFGSPLSHCTAVHFFDPSASLPVGSLLFLPRQAHLVPLCISLCPSVSLLFPNYITLSLHCKILYKLILIKFFESSSCGCCSCSSTVLYSAPASSLSRPNHYQPSDCTVLLSEPSENFMTIRFFQ